MDATLLAKKLTTLSVSCGNTNFLNEDIDVTLLDVTERQELRTKNMHTH